MRRILIIMGRYLPGYKDGGPVRSIKNLVDSLGTEYEFHILTCDRDHGDTVPYDGIKKGEYDRVGNALVYYTEPGGFTRELILKLSEDADMIYLCGCFNDYARTTLSLKKKGSIRIPVAVASMGLFSPREFHIKYPKKKAFVMLYNVTGRFDDIYWSCSSEREWKDVQGQIKTHGNCFIARDLPRLVDTANISKEKAAGDLKLFFIGRISQVKNLLGAAKTLEHVHGKVRFTIYGAAQDKEYWGQCKAVLDGLPKNVSWEWAGELPSEQVVDTLKKEDVLLLPSMGENYGHAIQEALSAGCPCVISDQTSWDKLEENGCGFECHTDDYLGMAEHIDEYAKMDNEQFAKCVDRAHDYAVKVSNGSEAKDQYRIMFDSLIKGDADRK